jgi:hypothetical protein
MNVLREQVSASVRRVQSARRKFERSLDHVAAEEWLASIDHLRAAVHVYTVASVDQPLDQTPAAIELHGIM